MGSVSFATAAASRKPSLTSYLSALSQPLCITWFNLLQGAYGLWKMWGSLSDPQKLEGVGTW